MIPIEISVGNRLFSQAAIHRFEVFDWIIDVIFILDIVLNFFTSYINDKTGFEIKEMKKISSNYIRTTFCIDILAAMPFEEIASVIFVQSSKENLRIRQLAGNEVNEVDDDGQDKKLKSFGMISTLKFI